MREAPPGRKSKTAAALDQALLTTLQEMLDDNETVTARGVVRRMAGVEAASSLTRDPWRSGIVAEFRAEQERVRRQVERTDKSSPTQVAAALAREKERNAVLERQVAILTASHLALIKAVGELGGLRAWARFFDGYDAAGQELRTLGAMPEGEVLPLRPADDKSKGRS